MSKHVASAPGSDSEPLIELDELPEFDFANAEVGLFSRWYRQARGHFHEVSDEEDAKRQVSRRRPADIRKSR